MILITYRDGLREKYKALLFLFSIIMLVATDFALTSQRGSHFSVQSLLRTTVDRSQTILAKSSISEDPIPVLGEASEHPKTPLLFYRNNTSVQNLHLAMLGDSVTRYQYLSLVNFIENGTWNTTFSRNGRIRDIVNEKSFPKNGWPEFYNFTNHLFNHKEVCDCHRNERRRDGTRKNRYYANPGSNNYVSYLQRFGDSGTRGMLEPTEIFDMTNNFHLNIHYTDFKWEHNLTSMIRDYVSKMKPKPQYFVFNAGLVWSKHDLNGKTLPAIREALLDNEIVGIYKVTTRTKLSRDKALAAHEELACQLFPCLNLQWTADLSPEDYWDDKHLLGNSYQRINLQLLELLEVLGASCRRSTR